MHDQNVIQSTHEHDYQRQNCFIEVLQVKSAQVWKTKSLVATLLHNLLHKLIGVISKWVCQWFSTYLIHHNERWYWHLGPTLLEQTIIIQLIRKMCWKQHSQWSMYNTPSVPFISLRVFFNFLTRILRCI